jgi:hypothetical protein
LQGKSNNIEFANRSLSLKTEEGNTRSLELLRHVHPWGKHAFSIDIINVVQDVVEHPDTVVRHPDFIHFREGQSEPDSDTF